MAKKISLPVVNALIASGAIAPLPVVVTEETPVVSIDPNAGTVLEGATGETDQTPAPVVEAAPEPVSNRMDELVVLTLEPATRTSGAHPKLKKSAKWLIAPKFNGRERWFDLTKIPGWNYATKQVVVSRSEVQHRGMESYIEAPFNAETHKEGFVFLKDL
ncbi:hypothetical protein EVB27_082 [Rhizobium phage RHph_TM16]|nr:hypothetical protein EVB27_082 [Rhizobium phage RHph_TM16]